MLRHVFALAAAASFGALACGSAPSEESIDGASTALFTSPTITMLCGSLRVDAYRPNHTCGDIRTSSPGGQWTIERLFPEETSSLVHDHFCAYTWVPSATSCQSAPIDALELDTYDPNLQAYGGMGVSDTWKISAGCTDGAACSGEQTAATERVENIEPARSIGCPWPYTANELCMVPAGGSCTTCGVVVGNKAFLLNPDPTSTNAITFDVPGSGGANPFQAKPEVVKHQFDVKPTHAIFVTELAPGVTYQSGRITSWKTQLEHFYQVPVTIKGR